MAIRNIILAILVTVTLGSVRPVAAATLSVPGSAATIGGALAQAGRGDIVLVACGTYFEHDLVLPAGVTLWSGTLQPACVIIDAGGLGRIFRCEGADSTTAVAGFTLTGGRALGIGTEGLGGAVLCRNAAVKFANCIFENNEAIRGGAVATSGSSRPRFEGCVFTGNFAANLGGALYLAGSRTTVDGCLLAQNWGGLGGAAVAVSLGTAILDGCTVAANNAEGEGGVIFSQGGNVRLERTLVARNGPAVYRAEPTGSAWFAVTNLYGNQGGNWNGPLAEQARLRGNLALDPQFCNPGGGNFALRSSSPCLRVTAPDGRRVRIGARDAGCPGR